MSQKEILPNYWDYLGLYKLLNLQNGLETEETNLNTDELHFIITHQSQELWFKLMLAELRQARDHLAAPHLQEKQVPQVVHHLRRVSEILRLAARTFGVMETLTPQDFMNFRDKLTPASGFQSFQMREIELILGIDWANRVKYATTDPLDHIRKLAKKSKTGQMAVEHINAVLKETTLRAALHNWLYRTPIQGSEPTDPNDEQQVLEFLNSYFKAIEAYHDSQCEELIRSSVSPAESLRKRFADNNDRAKKYLFAMDIKEDERPFVRRYRAALIFIESYRSLPLLAWPRLLIDTVVEVEQLLIMFRHRHARSVERIIGRRVGTGGSSGVSYLDKTTEMRIFTELSGVRTLLLPSRFLPELKSSEFYDFKIPTSETTAEPRQ